MLAISFQPWHHLSLAIQESLLSIHGAIPISSTHTMAAKQLPSTMRAWQYHSTAGGLDKNLTLNSSATMPTPKPNQHLIRVLAMAFNPVDYKVCEVQLINRLAVTKPATPGLDVAGRIVKPAAGSGLQEGQLVFGVAGASAIAGGALAEYAVINTEGSVAAPEGLSALHAASIPIAGLTAYQTIVPYVKAGLRVFVNGGSGGVGIFSIQIAKAVGCHVVASCSTPNVELCKSLGADEVIDYKKGSVLDALKKQSPPFDHIVDNVGGNYELFWRAHEYSQPTARYVYVGGAPTVSFGMFMLKAKLWPGFLGGAKRQYQGIFAQPRPEELKQIGQWILEGKIKPVIDSKVPFAEAPEGVRKQKSGRARGKIVVDVALEGEK